MHLKGKVAKIMINQWTWWRCDSITGNNEACGQHRNYYTQDECHVFPITINVLFKK